MHVSNKVKLDTSNQRNVCFVATSNFEPGQVVIKERPFLFFPTFGISLDPAFKKDNLTLEQREFISLLTDPTVNHRAKVWTDELQAELKKGAEVRVQPKPEENDTTPKKPSENAGPQPVSPVDAGLLVLSNLLCDKFEEYGRDARAQLLRFVGQFHVNDYVFQLALSKGFGQKLRAHNAYLQEVDGALVWAMLKSNAVVHTSNVAKINVGTTFCPVLARVNHACDANCMLVSYWSDVALVTRRSISKGEKLTFDYVGDMRESDYIGRSLKLANLHGFRCECKMCADKMSDPWTEDFKRAFSSVDMISRKDIEDLNTTLKGGTFTYQQLSELLVDAVLKALKDSDQESKRLVLLGHSQEIAKAWVKSNTPLTAEMLEVIRALDVVPETFPLEYLRSRNILKSCCFKLAFERDPQSTLKLLTEDEKAITAIAELTIAKHSGTTYDNYVGIDRYMLSTVCPMSDVRVEDLLGI